MVDGATMPQSKSLILVPLFTVLFRGGLCDSIRPLDQIVQRGMPARLTCGISGPARLKWFKDGIEIHSGHSFRRGLEHLYSIINDTLGKFDLFINKTDEETTGNYTCLRPGDLKNKTTRLMLGSGISEGKQGRVTSIPDHNDTWISAFEVVENGTTIKSASNNTLVIVASVALSLLAASLIVVLDFWVKRRKRQRPVQEAENKLNP